MWRIVFLEKEMVALTISDQTLTVAVLPTRKPALEFDACEEALSSDRRQVEARIYDIYAADHARAFLAIGCIHPAFRLSPSVEYWRSISAAYVHELLVHPQTEVVREKQCIELPGEKVVEWAARVPAMVGSELVDADFIASIWTLLRDAFVREVTGRSESIEDILRLLAPGQALLTYRIQFHLVENRQEEETPFAFLATYSAQNDATGRLMHLPLENALKEFGDDTRKLIDLLASVKRAAAGSDLIRSIMDSREIFHPLRFTPGEAYQFLLEAPLYEQVGILCRIPKWWSASPRKISVALSIGDSAGGKLGVHAMLSCAPLLHIDGEAISYEEAREILAQYDGLAMIKGKWTVVDRQSLQQNLELFESAGKMTKHIEISFPDAIRMLLGLQSAKIDDKTPWKGDVLCGDWLKDILGKLRSPASLQSVAVPNGLQTDLRPYQQAGLNWLTFLHDLGFGACLADDMGLGKTIQILSLLQSRKEMPDNRDGPSLLIVPASLIDNWLTEIRRFTPGLNTHVVHPQYTNVQGPESLPDNSFDLAITTYAMARKLSWLKDRQWYFLILDEAQAIKNPGSSQTRSVKAIPAAHRIVMTGTPVENRIGDIWSLFDFVNRGLLGSAQSFKKFAKTLSERPDGYGRMRQVIQPYILRRMKTDKTIIADLPEKIEMKTWAVLSKKQRVLYQRFVNELSDVVQESGGIQRKGMILSFLLKFKQVCNHPDQIAGAGGFREEDSGKLQRLREICESIHEKRERMLVFTQFREMVEPLDLFLKSVFGRPGVQLHGGTAVGKRKEIVAKFQNQDDYVPYFVLSLKAGGVGLNLTAASHVVHFDRWWNPAVEKQAEDRAFRIGQKRSVIVHKFVCKGTVEERIDQMIESKIELSEKILSSGAESWITEMSNDQIREMFTLTLTGDK